MKNNIVTPPKQEKQPIIATQQVQQFAGPIPSPDIFKQYGQVIPDAPERILRVFE